MRRWVLLGICVLIVSAAGVLGTPLVKDVLRLREIDAGRREQAKIFQVTREERKELREQVERAKAELKEIPDSANAYRGGRVMERSFDIAKQEAILEQNGLRAKRRLRHLDGQREAVVGSLSRRGAGLVLVEAFLIGGVVIVRRGARRTREDRASKPQRRDSGPSISTRAP